MSLEATVMLAVGALLVLGLAVYLVAIGLVLASVRRTLSSIITGLGVIERRTAGLDDVLATVNEDLDAAQEVFERLTEEPERRGAGAEG